jgi:hypothetical protein
MKTLLIATAASLALSATGFARIGEERDQIEARYGKAGKDLGSHGEVHEVGYVSNGFMILVDYVNGVSQREGFTKPDTTLLTEQNIKDILAMSAAEGTTWVEAAASNGDRSWDRSDNKVKAILPAMGKFLFVQDVNFTQPQ